MLPSASHVYLPGETDVDPPDHAAPERFAITGNSPARRCPTATDTTDLL
jgi:hypothetical protein